MSRANKSQRNSQKKVNKTTQEIPISTLTTAFGEAAKLELKKELLLEHLTCKLCKGLYRDAHTINECMCTFCKQCIIVHYSQKNQGSKCPACGEQMHGNPINFLVKDITLQNIADWLVPQFKQREMQMKSDLLNKARINRRVQGASTEIPVPTAMPQQTSSGRSSKGQKSSTAAEAPDQKNQEINFEFKLLPFDDDDMYLRMEELPKKLKYANKQKTILTVKKHIHNYTKEPVDNIELLCKNFPVADAHTLEYVRKTKWQNHSKTMVLMYKRKKRVTTTLKPIEE